ncbi:hypothetical protein BU24DRAFT_409877 [Aaosphaeria arxii CBS 175.79]|uniref:Uncharacterized protein n=1 Tax=Aaosphaeria arxii CBS 175.79 TaxID=1450172 RepID=A0A6A5XLG2_9PLEO|nr:uncharacterized protein BU24DRAFT_409877 [Aaosphaeria arxii CBS 175.79]KAF2014105.1 hypothetical protein BU24DRAFT_409877 [Aaosphaeria arxii CBS 175.79]
MPLYRRTRPTPIQIYRRQESSIGPTETGLPSPESPDSPTESPLSSPDSPESKEGDIEGDESGDEDEEQENTASQSGVPGPSPSTSETGPVPTSIDGSQTTSLDPNLSTSTTSVAGPPEQALPTTVNTNGSPTITAQPQITNGPSTLASGSSFSEGSTSALTNISSGLPNPGLDPVTSTLATSTVPSAAQSEVAGNAGSSSIGQDQPQRATQNDGGGGGGMSKAAEASLITFSILGGIAVLIAVIIFLRKRNRAKRQSHLRHAEDAFDPGNTGTLQQPETVHTSHFTRSTTNTASLFGGDHYQRPETVSTDNGRSRIAPPQPTPNPFADPPLNKAYDVLRGRPRSTTLTDRGSWTQNPFQNPISERFDPFGELQDKARAERERYMEELQHEHDVLQKERMGLSK